jgi:hypothetical protein
VIIKHYTAKTSDGGRDSTTPPSYINGKKTYINKKNTEILKQKFEKWIKNLEHYYFDILDYSEKRLKGGL